MQVKDNLPVLSMSSVLTALENSGEIIYEYALSEDEFRYCGNLLTGEMVSEGLEQDTPSLDDRYSQMFHLVRNWSRVIFVPGKKVHPEDALKVSYFLKGNLHGPILIRIRQENKSGYSWVSVEGRAFYEGKDRPQRIIGKIRDITARKKREEELIRHFDRDPITNFLFWNTGIRFLNEIWDSERRMRDAAFVYLRIDNMRDLVRRLGDVFRDATLSRAAIAIRDLTTEEERKIRVGDTSLVVFFRSVTDKQLTEFKTQLAMLLDEIYTGSVAGIGLQYSFRVLHSFQELLDFVPEDERYQGNPYGVQEFSEDIIHFAFHLIGKSDNLTNAVDKLLERMGMELRIDFIHIFQKDRDTSMEQMTCYHSYIAREREGEIYPDDKISLSKEFIDELEGRFHVEHSFVLDQSLFRCLPEDLKGRLEDYNTSVLICPIRSGGRIQGFVIFEVTDTRYIWSDSLRDILAELTNIIGSYILRELANEASAAKTNFLASMSHEIRTPMNAISGFSELILSEEGISDTTKEYAANIRNATQNLLSIINQILDVSKVEAGKFELFEDKYQLSSLLNDVSIMVRVRLGDKPISFRVEMKNEIPEGLYGDVDRIRQVFTNILNNAVKYTEKGEILLSVSWEKRGEKEGVLRASVKDTGIGIREEDIGKLFQSFSQVDTKRNKGIMGTGLGLAVSKSLLGLMKGNITVQSSYGEGSEFSFCIPQLVTDARPCAFELDKEYTVDERKFVLPFLAPKARFLVVDDNPVNLEVAKGLLKQYRSDVVKASSGQACLNILEEDENFDLIFMDQMMPVMDGLETTGRIRSMDSAWAKEVPVIALTANAIKGVEQEFFRAGMNDCVTKPINLKHLAETLNKWLPEDLKEYGGESPGKGDEARNSLEKSIDFTILKGIDSEAGLENSLGNRENYLDLLSLFISTGDMDKSDRLLRAGDVENYKITVHAMKSAARYIGAMELSDCARSCEDLAKAELEREDGSHEGIKEITGQGAGPYPEIWEMQERLRLLYDPVAGSIEELLSHMGEGETEEKDRPLLEGKKLKEALLDLNLALQDYDQDEVERILSYLSDFSLGSLQAEELFRDIQKDYDDFEYEAAAEKCEKLASMNLDS
ncbi:MAG: response regulator [Lachnospiraceae bacterium]|nr:response regulator [Lachnospiraceae bacterium]